MTMPTLPSVIAAEMRVLDPLLAAQQLLGLIEGAARAGILDLLATGATVDDIAADAGLAIGTATAIVDALLLAGVAEPASGAFRLHPDWQAVCSDSGPRPLRATLAGERVGTDQLRHLGTTGDDRGGWSGDGVALASSMAPDPVQGALVPVLPALAEAGSRLPAAAAKGGRYLELGCGVAGYSLTLLQAFPGLTVVGVELRDDLAAEAERRAASLGLQDRFTAVRGDAVGFSDREPFDIGFWSQFFFAEASRPGALAALHSNVRPGGLVAAPVVHPTGEEPLPVRQRIALLTVMTQTWGVPDRTPDELVDEFRRAGFVDVELTDQNQRSSLVTGIRP